MDVQPFVVLSCVFSALRCFVISCLQLEREGKKEREKREKAKEMSTDAKVSEWVDILSDCKVLSESEMKQLCDIVRGFLGTL